MATAVEKLSFAESQLTHSSPDQSFEYWNGEAVPKAMASWVHGVLQATLSGLLRRAGYKSGSEVELRLVSDYHPKPDVIATRGRIEGRYPTEPFDVAVEILSPEDSMSFLLEKCSAYSKWGIGSVYVADPEARVVYEWTDRGLLRTEDLASIPVDEIWSALDRELS